MKPITMLLGTVLVPLATTMAWAADTPPGGDSGNPVPGPYGYGHMMWGHGWGGGWGYGWGPGLVFHPFFTFLSLVGLVVVATWIVRLISHGSIRHPHAGAEGPGRSQALNILEERFARGEIGKEEFEDKRRTIGGR